MFARIRVRPRARPAPGCRAFRLLIAVIALGQLAGCARQDTAEPGAAALDCGAITAWDSDGDGVSDAVEAANAGRFAPAVCDRDDSRSVGEYVDGALEGGVNLPDAGSGYRHFAGGDPRDADDWGTLDLVNCVEAVGRELAEVGLTVHVGDLSKQAGGTFFPHKAHQIGREVDVRYARRDGQDLPLDLRLDGAEYDPLLTRDLFERFSRHCPVSVIFADVQRLQFATDGSTMASVVDDPDRRNHFMVRLEK